MIRRTWAPYLLGLTSGVLSTGLNYCFCAQGKIWIPFASGTRKGPVIVRMPRRTPLARGAAAMVAVGLALGSAPSALGAERLVAAATPGAAVQVVIIAPDLVRQDRMSDVSVVFTGVDAKTKARVNWGTGAPTEVRVGRCSVKGASANPQACSVMFTPPTYLAGQYTITATSAVATASKVLTVAENPVAWSPPSGWVQPSAWALLSGRATYTPCQTVDWYFNRSGEPSDRSTMIDDVRSGLAILSAQTGLKFVEVTDPGQAELAFDWADLTARGPDVAGVGGPRGTGRGTVTFSNNQRWTLNEWAGQEIRRVEWPRPDLGPGWYSYREGPGRQVLVMHEAMHAMGFGHVSDYTSIMYPQSLNNGAGQLSAGDIDGLRTMYPSNPCPVIPD